MNQHALKAREAYKPTYARMDVISFTIFWGQRSTTCRRRSQYAQPKPAKTVSVSGRKWTRNAAREYANALERKVGHVRRIMVNVAGGGFI